MESQGVRATCSFLFFPLFLSHLYWPFSISCLFPKDGRKRERKEISILNCISWVLCPKFGVQATSISALLLNPSHQLRSSHYKKSSTHYESIRIQYIENTDLHLKSFYNSDLFSPQNTSLDGGKQWEFHIWGEKNQFRVLRLEISYL